jgi:hypothetical protein
MQTDIIVTVTDKHVYLQVSEDYSINETNYN